MVIYWGNSIEEILNKNLKNDGAVIGVGVDIVVKPFNNDKPFFYQTNIRCLTKEDLHRFIGEWHKEDEYFDRYMVAVKANVNKVIDEFKESADNSKLVTVLENNWYTKKLINTDTIQEVRGFVFDPTYLKYKE